MTCWLMFALGVLLGVVAMLVLAGFGWASEMDAQAQRLHRERFKEPPE